MKALRSLRAVIGVISLAIGVAGTVGLMVHVAVDVAMRAAGSPLLGTVEFIMYLYMPALALGGLALAQRHGEHIAVDIIAGSLGGRARAISTGLLLGVTLAFALVLAYFVAQKAEKSFAIGETAGVSGLPVWPGQVLVAGAFLLFAIEILFELVDKKSYADSSDQSAEPAGEMR